MGKGKNTYKEPETLPEFGIIATSVQTSQTCCCPRGSGPGVVQQDAYKQDSDLLQSWLFVSHFSCTLSYGSLHSQNVCQGCGYYCLSKDWSTCPITHSSTKWRSPLHNWKEENWFQYGESIQYPLRKATEALLNIRIISTGAMPGKSSKQFYVKNTGSPLQTSCSLRCCIWCLQILNTKSLCCLYSKSKPKPHTITIWID